MDGCEPRLVGREGYSSLIGLGGATGYAEAFSDLGEADEIGHS